MPVLRIQEFAGTIPVSGDRALPDNFGAHSKNTWLYSKELRGIRPPVDLIAIQTASRRVLRIPTTSVPSDVTAASTWLQFTDPDTDILKGQLVEDSYKRWYFCSPTTGPLFNTFARMQAGQASYRLGAPGPNIIVAADGSNPDKPTIPSITGGATPVATVAYLYTWTNEFGEESAPSLPVTGAGNANAIWNIANIKDPPAPAANQPAWSKKTLYRTAPGTGQFYKVNDIAIGTLTYADNHAQISDDILVGNLPLASTSWQPPPTDLKGWIAMPNGFLIGFKDNNIYMSEAYHWHAWPLEYKYATETPIVGLGIIGQTCVVCTQGYPATVTGTKPSTCSFTKATTGEPCLSRGSIVSTPNGVIYASQNGLMMVGPNGMSNITQQLITREEWMKDYAPSSLRAERYQNGYLAIRTIGAPNNSAFFLDPTELRVAVTELTDFNNVVTINLDFWSGEPFILEPGQVMRWDPPTNDLMAVCWLSKEFQYQYEENFGAYVIYWDDDRYSGFDWGTSLIPIGQKVRMRVLADRVTVYDQEVPANGEPIRLPSGFKSDIWQFEIRARAPVYSLHVASTMKELKRV